MTRRILPSLMVLGVLFALIGPAEAASSSRAAVRAVRPAAPERPAGGVVGNGNPGSCDDAALTTGLAGGGTVTFQCGGPKTILVTSAKTIAADTTIIGGDVITLTGGFATRLFNVNSGVTLRLQHIVLDGAANSGSDGGAIASNGTLYLESSTIQNSQTDINHSGGAIFSDGPVFITDSLLKNNQAGSGGALFANFGNARVNINNSTISDNQAINTGTGYGGAIWIGEQAQLVYTNGQLSGNTANYGGALYLSPQADATLVGLSVLVIVFNMAATDGGAIYSNGGTLRVARTGLFLNRTMTTTIGIGYGGAIASYGPLSLTYDGFYGNQGRFGGAVFVGDGPPNAAAIIDHSLFSQNVAGSLGGGLYTHSDTVAMTVTDSAFDQNSAVGIGGGIGRFNTPLKIFRSSITNNTAATGGGLNIAAGPGVDHGGYVLVRDSTIGFNTATSGHGGGVASVALSEFINVTIKDNTNGVYNTDGVMFVANTVLHNPNSLNCDGSGILPQSHAGNFSSDNSCNLTSSGDEQGVGHDPMLGPLTVDVAGITFYYMPLAGSPLIDTAFASCSPRDQRGALRPDACDKGAVEYRGQLPWVYLPLIRR